MSRTDIANYLRLAPETVSRVLRRFQDEGMVESSGASSRSATSRSCTRSRALSCAI
jgi:Mn-dependent DtxR family transcriptional regulator